ncbi:hypothetical protein [Phreatobacter sp.]|uniref:hypothetical protein n=1 Tax=Phreatobacter sp. TaxID=1966341 RepID=UPI003F6EEC45
MTQRFMRICAAALFALAATHATAPAGAANPRASNHCPIETGLESQYLMPSEAFMQAAGAGTMLYRVMSLVAGHFGDFDVEMAIDGPIVGATKESHAELMNAITNEFGMMGAPDAASEPANQR